MSERVRKLSISLGIVSMIVIDNSIAEGLTAMVLIYLLYKTDNSSIE